MRLKMAPMIFCPKRSRSCKKIKAKMTVTIVDVWLSGAICAAFPPILYAENRVIAEMAKSRDNRANLGSIAASQKKAIFDIEVG